LLCVCASRSRHTRSKRDWSSDVCSSDLVARGQWDAEVSARGRGEGEGTSRCWPADAGRTMLAGSRGHRLAHPPQARPVGTPTPADRKSVVEGKSGAGREGGTGAIARIDV